MRGRWRLASLQNAGRARERVFYTLQWQPTSTVCHTEVNHACWSSSLGSFFSVWSWQQRLSCRPTVTRLSLAAWNEPQITRWHLKNLALWHPTRPSSTAEGHVASICSSRSSKHIEQNWPQYWRAANYQTFSYAQNDKKHFHITCASTQVFSLQLNQCQQTWVAEWLTGGEQFWLAKVWLKRCLVSLCC